MLYTNYGKHAQVNYNISGPILTCQFFAQHIFSDNFHLVFQEEEKCKKHLNVLWISDIILHVSQYLLKTRGVLKIYIPSEVIFHAEYQDIKITYPFRFPNVFISSHNRIRSSHLIYKLTDFVLCDLFYHKNNPYTLLDFNSKSQRYLEFQRAKKDFIENYCTHILKLSLPKKNTVEKLKIILRHKKTLTAVAYFYANHGNIEKAREVIEKNLKHLNYPITKMYTLIRYLEILWGEKFEEISDFIFSVFDWGFYNLKNYPSDGKLLNILPAIYILNSKLTLVQKCLKPLMQYWEKYITPLINKELENTWNLKNVYFVKDNELKNDLSWTLKNNSKWLYKSLSLSEIKQFYISKEEALILYQLMKDSHEILIKHNITYWIDSGTLLGAIRHQGLIPFDGDLDINILHQDELKFRDIVYEFKNIGYEITYRENGSYMIFRGKNYRHIDILVVRNLGDRYVFSGMALRKKYNKNFFYAHELFPLAEYKFGQIKVYGPNKPINYLDRVYPGWNEFFIIHDKVVRQGIKQEGIKEMKIKLFNEVLEPAKPIGPLHDRILNINFQDTYEEKPNAVFSFRSNSSKFAS